MLPIDYFLFLQIAFFLTITPGTPRVVIMTYAINYGLKRSVITAVGDVSANTLQMILVTFGIGVLVSAYPNILNYLRWIGVFYLLFIAFDLVRYSKNLDFDKSLPYIYENEIFYSRAFSDELEMRPIRNETI